MTVTYCRIVRAAIALLALAAVPGMASADISGRDRVYTADQSSNTVSVYDPSTNRLLGQIVLGQPRPDVLSPIYRGQANVHGLGFSPDHRTLAVISTASNAVTFIDTATNRVKGTTYVGRSPHEGFFTPDGKEFWCVVRGENYLSVIDPVTFKETRRIIVADGPGMVLFRPDGQVAFVVSSFTPEVDVVDTHTYQIVKRIPVVSPFSPNLAVTKDGDVWMTHKDVGKVTVIDGQRFEVRTVLDTGLVTNHVNFIDSPQGRLAYVSIGGEDVVKVFTRETSPKLIATIPTGALPHGLWPSDDGTRIYVALENGDGVSVIDTATQKEIARIPGGQAPQALVYISNAVPGGPGTDNLQPLGSGPRPVTLQLRPSAAGSEARGFLVIRSLGPVDGLDISVFHLTPNHTYGVYASANASGAADGLRHVTTVRTNAMGGAAGQAIGALRDALASTGGTDARTPPQGARYIVVAAIGEGVVSPVLVGEVR